MEDMENQVPSNNEPDARRAAIEAAFEQLEQTEAEDEVTPQVVEPVEAAEAEVAPEAEPVDTEAKAEVTNEPEEQLRDERTKEKEARAPQSWKPEAREKWASLPDEAKREIVRREREIATTLQQSADERKFAHDMHSLFQPYDADMRALGVTPKAVVQDLLNVSHVLRRGGASEKADMVARVIEQHGVDLVVLNDRLMKKQPEQTQDANPAISQRLAQLEAAEQARQREVLERTNSTINSEIDAFSGDPKNEFFHDVAPLMVAMLQNGQAETLADAYEKAVWAHPETRKVLTGRQAQTQNKLAAASSVKGSSPKATQHAKPQLTDRRAALEAAFDQLSGKRT